MITLTTSVGAVTLEGSGDFGNNDNYDTLFTLAAPAPVANNDTVTTNEDTAKSFNVLTNDSSPSNGPLSVTSYTQAAHGTLIKGASGSFTYTPAKDYSGTDSFTYTISDGKGSATATVNVTVTAVNDPPVAVNGSKTTPEDTSITILVATDVDSTVLTSVCTTVPPGVGTTVDNGNGTITFTPPDDFNGSVTISCSVTDDKGASTQPTSTANLQVDAVNDAPDADDDSASVSQNTSTAGAGAPAANGSTGPPATSTAQQGLPVWSGRRPGAGRGPQTAGPPLPLRRSRPARTARPPPQGSRRTRVVLPIPAGPSISTKRGWPARVCSSMPRRRASIGWRPTNGARERGVADAADEPIPITIAPADGEVLSTRPATCANQLRRRLDVAACRFGAFRRLGEHGTKQGYRQASSVAGHQAMGIPTPGAIVLPG